MVFSRRTIGDLWRTSGYLPLAAPAHSATHKICSNRTAGFPLSPQGSFLLQSATLLRQTTAAREGSDGRNDTFKLYDVIRRDIRVHSASQSCRQTTLCTLSTRNHVVRRLSVRSPPRHSGRGERNYLFGSRPSLPCTRLN